MSVASRRERERAERRTSITEAAARVFRRQGIAGATMDDVAAEAELSKGTLYLYFASKEELFLAVAAEKIKRIGDRFDQVLAAAGDRPGLDLVADLLENYADVALEDPQMFRVAISWISSPDDVDTETEAFTEHRARIHRNLHAIVGAIERGHKDGSIRRELEPLQLAGQLWGGLVGVVLIRSNADELSRRFPLAVDFEKLVAGYLDMVCDGLRPRGDVR